MNFLTASNQYLCFVGKDKVHLVPLNLGLLNVCSIGLNQSCPSAVVASRQGSIERATGVCANISSDSKYFAVADSKKQVYVYQNSSSNIWNLIAHFETEKRLLQVQFNYNSSFLVLSDKCGDVWTISLSSLREKNMPTKILGHCSVVLDTCLSRKGTNLFTCDRDEKIRLSSFPDSYIISSYFLGHKEAVVSIFILKSDEYLLSVDIHGIAKLWRIDNSACFFTVNIFSVFQIDASEKDLNNDEINAMKCTEAFGKCYFTVRILNYSRLPVFELDLMTVTVHLVGVIDVMCSLYDMCWVENVLYVANPNMSEGLIQAQITEDGKLHAPTKVTFSKIEGILTDVQSFIEINKMSIIPLRKRVAHDTNNKQPRSKVQCRDIETKT